MLGAPERPWQQAAGIAGLGALDGRVEVRVEGATTTLALRVGTTERAPSTHPTPRTAQEYEALLFLVASWLHHLPRASGPDAAGAGLSQQLTALPASRVRASTHLRAPPPAPAPTEARALPPPAYALHTAIDALAHRPALIEPRSFAPTRPRPLPAPDHGAPWVRADGAVVGRPEHRTVGGFDLTAGWRTPAGLRVGLGLGARSPVRRLDEPVARPAWDAPLLAWLGWDPHWPVAPRIELGLGPTLRHLRQDEQPVATVLIPTAAARLGVSLRADDRWRFVASATAWFDLQRLVASVPSGETAPWQPATVGGTLGIEWGPPTSTERFSRDPSAPLRAPLRTE